MLLRRSTFDALPTGPASQAMPNQFRAQKLNIQNRQSIAWLRRCGHGKPQCAMTDLRQEQTFWLQARVNGGCRSGCRKMVPTALNHPVSTSL
jgi:hypothetical protein